VVEVLADVSGREGDSVQTISEAIGEVDAHLACCCVHRDDLTQRAIPDPPGGVSSTP
jgi:hypothetical protein